MDKIIEALEASGIEVDDISEDGFIAHTNGIEYEVTVNVF